LSSFGYAKKGNSNLRGFPLDEGGKKKGKEFFHLTIAE